MLNIFFLGLISFFTDLSTEMVYPLIPLYLVQTGATHVLVGIIEGIAESLASLLKVYSGYLPDKFQKKKLIAFSGYAAGLVYKLALIFANSWIGILGAKVIDRFGKGIRTAPRDVLVSESTDKKHLGKAFGFHKALDKAGAALGILIIYLIMLNSSGNYDFKTFFALSMIPAVLGLLMFIFVKEKKQPVVLPSGTKIQPQPFWKNIKQIDGQLKFYLLVVFIFTLGNSSKAFMILKASDAGFDNLNVILLFLIYHFVAALLSMPLGKLSDKIGRKNLLVPGYLVFALCYLGFAFGETKLIFVILFALYGIYTAMITGVERAFVAEIAPDKLKGTMLGLHSTISGIALLPASIIAGVLWTNFGAAVPFIFGAAMSLLAAVLLFVFMKGKKTVTSSRSTA
ncbi:MAG: MFS transporter [Treponema sp.]|jgi:MFS family permease|nr:MFS transporter [Treponema sp.]